MFSLLCLHTDSFGVKAGGLAEEKRRLNVPRMARGRNIPGDLVINTKYEILPIFSQASLARVPSAQLANRLTLNWCCVGVINTDYWHQDIYKPTTLPHPPAVIQRHTQWDVSSPVIEDYYVRIRKGLWRRWLCWPCPGRRGPGGWWPRGWCRAPRRPSWWSGSRWWRGPPPALHIHTQKPTHRLYTPEADHKWLHGQI